MRRTSSNDHHLLLGGGGGLNVLLLLLVLAMTLSASVCVYLVLEVYREDPVRVLNRTTLPVEYQAGDSSDTSLKYPQNQNHHQNQDSGGGHYELVWRDEFDDLTGEREHQNVDDHLNRSLWTPLIGLRGFLGGEQTFIDSPSNFRVRNGFLHMRMASLGRLRTSGALQTLSSSWTFGRFVVRARLPSDRRVSLCVSLWPADSNYYGSSSASGTVRLIDYQGGGGGGGGDHKRPHLMQGITYAGPVNRTDPKTGRPVTVVGEVRTQLNAAGSTPPRRSLRHDFHVYSADWSPNRLDLRMDGRLQQSLALDEGTLWTGPAAMDPYAGEAVRPFDRPFKWFLYMLAHGVHDDPDRDRNLTSNAEEDEEDREQQMASSKPVAEIDYIRVYRHVEVASRPLLANHVL